MFLRNHLAPVLVRLGEARRILNTPAGKNHLIILGYIIAISAAEAVTTMVNPLLGVVAHAVILSTLMVHGALVHKGPVRRVLIVLSLAPLIRILSLTLPLGKLGLPVIYWYLLIGAPIFLAAYIAGRVGELSGDRIGINVRGWPRQILLGLTGFGLGIVEYLILRPGPMAPELSVIDVLTASFILLVFTGVLEEVVFRGLMQSATMQVLGRPGLWYIAFLFAILHLGYHSFTDLLFVLAVGLIFGFMVWKTDSLLGAALSHGIANISLYVFLPYILAAGPAPIASTGTPVPTAETAASAVASFTPGPDGGGPVILVDNDGEGFFHAGQNFFLDAARGFGGSFRWAYAAQSVPDVVATWIPNLAGCGIYNVEVFIPLASGATGSARYMVNSGAGQTLIDINQAANGGKWVSLGEFEFDIDGRSSLQLSNLTGDEPRLMRWVGFDAVRWRFLNGCSSATLQP